MQFAYFFERAATDFNSSVFAWAARELWSNAVPDTPPKPNETDAIDATDAANGGIKWGAGRTQRVLRLSTVARRWLARH